MPISTIGFGHIRLTVCDMRRSREFYDQVFGLPVAFEVPEDADDATREQLAFLYDGVIYAVPGGGLLGLRPVAPAGDRFDPDRVGLDHFSLAVESEQLLQDAAALLDGMQVAHSGVKDIGVASILEFRDPDGIALELIAGKG